MKSKESLAIKKIFIITIIFITMMIIMNILALKLTNELSAQILDFTIGYNSDYVYNFLNSLQESGRNFYFKLLLLDFLFPITYMLFGTTLLSYLLKNYLLNKTIKKIIIFIPVLGMLFDFAENILILIMLRSFPQINTLVSSISSFLTFTKFIFTISTLIISGILFIINILKRKCPKRIF